MKVKSDAAAISAKKRFIDLLCSSAPKANAVYCTEGLFKIGMG